jgi:hypothetical protein
MAVEWMFEKQRESVKKRFYLFRQIQLSFRRIALFYRPG